MLNMVSAKNPRSLHEYICPMVIAATKNCKLKGTENLNYKKINVIIKKFNKNVIYDNNI